MVNLINLLVFNGRVIELLNIIWDRVLEIAKQPLLSKDMLWILLPLLLTLLLIELYFGRYKREELGWNSALGNSLVLFFVGMNLFSWLQRNDLLYFAVFGETALAKSIIAAVVTLESILLIALNFFHATPKKIAFSLSSVLLLNFIGVISIILVYSPIDMGILTLLASVVLFVLLCFFVKSLQLFEKEPIEKEFVEAKEKLKEKKIEFKEIKVEKKITAEEEKEKEREEEKREKGKKKSKRKKVKRSKKTRIT